jgi:hypothetical protein
MTKLMHNAGFTDADVGPFASELRAALERKQADGLVSMSAGTWADGPFWTIEAEVRAQAILGMEWAMERGHSYRVECLDPPIEWQHNARTMKRSLRVSWHKMPAWLGDRWRELGMHYRVWRDRKLVNPYRSTVARGRGK